jgi:hypothetical protein
MFPSGPVVMPAGTTLAGKPSVTPPVNSVADPSGVIRTTCPGFSDSVNQRLPSAPTVMYSASPFAENPAVNSVTSPAGVMRPIAPGFLYCVNHRLPSGPATMSSGPMFAVKSGVSPPVNSVKFPAGVTFSR